MHDANRLWNEFERGWTRALVDQRVWELTDVILSHEMIRVDCAMRRSDYDQYISRVNFGQLAAQPYFLCFYGLALGIIKSKVDLDINCDVDLIFDEQSTLGDKVLSWWPYVKEMLSPALDDFSRPIFRNDRKFRPLQAADLYAW